MYLTLDTSHRAMEQPHFGDTRAQVSTALLRAATDRGAKPWGGCTEKQRAEWKERKTYMQHVFEILQTEEIYVSFRLACEHAQEQQRFEVFLRR